MKYIGCIGYEHKLEIYCTTTSMWVKSPPVQHIIAFPVKKSVQIRSYLHQLRVSLDSKDLTNRISATHTAWLKGCPLVCTVHPSNWWPTCSHTWVCIFSAPPQQESTELTCSVAALLRSKSDIMQTQHFVLLARIERVKNWEVSLNIHSCHHVLLSHTGRSWPQLPGRHYWNHNWHTSLQLCSIFRCIPIYL